mmetsp:Transcript_515/g.998  ORF Transcript_515/g.998 Transcript_515/m.998 type:complete len:129 (+) Transcript_515:677-1063(+)|eukprot:CAMPEP_0168608616 /NCGR_PEP_ID=MMETSP0449_2-20121227/730_1 /TAXON_ID=1082188 /ORGANISM="Strombidium rassoulzadegani, Strain ras09" /LENGTH=128 /DNA_ID=CAMNT_0008648629 /DNA_START=671 /DNA_END=1057 /DNA_ORIENTATION=+
MRHIDEPGLSQSFFSQANKGPLKKILVVDDWGFNIMALKIILRIDCGIDPELQIDSANDGRQALSMVKSNVRENMMERCDYEFILMDCNMPKMDGYQATSAIRHFLHVSGLPQPIISAVTGHSESSYV